MMWKTAIRKRVQRPPQRSERIRLRQSRRFFLVLRKRKRWKVLGINNQRLIFDIVNGFCEVDEDAERYMLILRERILPVLKKANNISLRKALQNYKAWICHTRDNLEDIGNAIDRVNEILYSRIYTDDENGDKK